MRIALTGATGFVGRHLAPALIARGHEVVCISRDAGRARAIVPPAALIAEADVRDAAALERALAGADVAYYLVHSMEGDAFGFEERDRAAARAFAAACDAAGVRHIVFLGGLGDDASQLSAHLRSRHETGELLRGARAHVTEMRAGLIIGSGSASFTMLKQLVERLPFMITPRWVQTRTQPIAIDDVVRYLVAAGESPDVDGDRIYEVGGPEVMDYRTMMQRFAAWNGTRRIMVPVPVLTPRLSSYWVDLVTDVPASLARPLIEGLRSEMIVRDDAAARVFGPATISFEEALERAAATSPEKREPPMWWLRRLPGHLRGVLARRFWPAVLTNEQVRVSAAPRDALWQSMIAIGGRRGYPVVDGLWVVRGWVDRLLGGYGLNRNGPAGDEVRVGERLDFWEVVELEPGTRLRLRSLMKMPGEAELELAVRPASNGYAVVQTARFRPTNVLGRLYWWALLPAHVVIFGSMIGRLVGRAEATQTRN